VGRCRGSEMNRIEDEYEGFFSEKKCPRCGSRLLTNRLGHLWCSYILCTYGIDGAEDDPNVRS